MKWYTVLGFVMLGIPTLGMIVWQIVHVPWAGWFWLYGGVAMVLIIIGAVRSQREG